MSHEAQPEDDDLARLLRRAGRRPAPTAEQLERWQRQFITVSNQRRRLRTFAGAGAALAAGLVALFLLMPVLLMPGAGEPAGEPAVVARVVKQFGGTVVRRQGAIVRSLQSGDAVLDGEWVESGLRSGLALRVAGVDLRVDAQTRLRLTARRIDLRAGRIYIDTHTDSRAAGSDAAAVTVTTPRGDFRHLGTQYTVTVRGDVVIGEVREGSIELRHDDAALRIDAPARGARRVLVDAGSQLRQRDVPAWGSAWAWALTTSPGLAVKNLPVDTVLRWVARERGMHLVYADDAAARTATQVILGGSGTRFAPEQALQVVTAGAPSLQVRDQGDGTLIVGLAPGGAG